MRLAVRSANRADRVVRVREAEKWLASWIAV
jgi:hypothetical protein